MVRLEVFFYRLSLSVLVGTALLLLLSITNAVAVEPLVAGLGLAVMVVITIGLRFERARILRLRQGSAGEQKEKALRCCFRCGRSIKAGQPFVRAGDGRESHFGCTMGALGDVDALGRD